MAGSPVDVAEARALAGAFAADLLSWDPDDPDRHRHAVDGYRSSSGTTDPPGPGRLRADLVLPGAARHEDDRVHVDVRVRVVPYRRVDARGPGGPEPEPPEPLGVPSAAPAPAARGWRALSARWVRLEVTVARAGDRLVVTAPDRVPGAGPDR
ncbi:hypothetical protein WIS52_29200 [Pseudonocardia nematodicida]|uniref:Uncharacterized protein n=1 Tax=Pseudonocardia nematodicida TaxID=1206997 RepID=A0ABV1KJD7_9PSEU